MNNNPPALMPGKLPTMPTVETFSRVLSVRRYESGSIDWNIQVWAGRVIPAQACHAILAELEAASVPATKAQAAAAATFLIGAYRATDLNDPRIFTRIIASTLQEFPAGIAAKAVDELTRTSKWLPSRAELIDACEALMDERRYAERVVKAHLAEHAERDRRREEERLRLERRAARYDAEPWLQLVDEFTATIPALRAAPHADDALKRLCEEFGADQVRAWLDELAATERKPAHWMAFLDAMTPRMQAARKAMAATFPAPAARP